MTQIVNIHGSAMRNLKFELDKDKKKHGGVIRSERRKEGGKRYMKTYQLFTLFIGGINTGIKRTMLGRDAKLANSMSLQKFIANNVNKISAWSPLRKDNIENEV